MRMRLMLNRAVLSVACLVAAVAPSHAQELSIIEQAAFRAAVDRVAPAVVSIETIGGLEQVGEVLVGTGSSCGLVVDPDGFIVSSSFNFMHRPASIVVTMPDGSRTAAKLVARDETRKLVLLKVTTPFRFPPLDAVPEGEVRVGMWALAVGRGFEASKPNMSVGIVSAVRRIWGKAVQTDAKISPANYGGPLLDVRGRVIGVLVPMSPNEREEVSGVEWYDSGIGFAIPLVHILRVLPRLKAGEDLKQGLVGVRFQGENIYADSPKLAHVRANSPAYKVGLRRGDLITAVDGRPVELQVQVMEQIQRRYAGESLKVTVARGSEKFDRDVPLVAELEPYRRPFLGLLAERPTGDDKSLPAGEAGAVVRYVFDGSPAGEKKLTTGDRITTVNGRKVADRDALATAVAESEPGKAIELEVVRGSEILKVSLTPTSQPETIPAEIPAAKTPSPAAGADAAKGGDDFPIKIAEFANACRLYVPGNYDDRVPHGIVVLLNRNGRSALGKDVLNRWREAGASQHLLVLVPQAAEDDGWSRPDVEFLGKAIDRVAEQYRVDPRRVVAHGIGTGGNFAAVATGTLVERVRGVAVVDSAALAGNVENEPATPLAFYAVTEPDFSGKPQLTAAAERLRKLHFPVTLRQLDDADYPTGEQFADLLRWIDMLDRI